MQLRGSAWEEKLCNHLRSLCRTDTTITFMDYTSVNFLSRVTDIISSDKNHLIHYIYQASIDISTEIVPEVLKRVNASVSRIIPDLLKLYRKSVNDPWNLMVIDAKSSLKLKQSHQAQVSWLVSLVPNAKLLFQSFQMYVPFTGCLLRTLFG